VPEQQQQQQLVLQQQQQQQQQLQTAYEAHQQALRQQEQNLLQMQQQLLAQLQATRAQMPAPPAPQPPVAAPPQQPQAPQPPTPSFITLIQQNQQQQQQDAEDEEPDAEMEGNAEEVADDDSTGAPMPEHAFAYFGVNGKNIFAYAQPKKKKIKNKKTNKVETKEIKADTSKAPRVPPKIQHLAGELATLSKELQWIIVEKVNTMLDLNDKLSRKVDSLSDENKQSHYYDKFDLDSDGKPKKKPFIHTCLRDKPKLTCSKRVRSDDRVDDVRAEISDLQQEGLVLQDQLKNKLAKLITAITKKEVVALRRLLILEYFELAVFMAGCIVLNLQKPARGGFVRQTDDLDILILKILEIHIFEVTEEDWIKILQYDDKTPGDLARGQAGVELLKHFDINPDQINAKYNAADNDLAQRASTDLLNSMKTITKKIFPDVAAAKADAKAEGEKVKFLGIERCKQKQDKLAAAIEKSNGQEEVQDIARQEANDAVEKNNSKQRRAARKKSSGEQKDRAQTPAKNGPNGKRRTGRSRERSQRKSRRQSADSSPASSASTRSRSRNKRVADRSHKKGNRRSRSRSRRSHQDDCHSQEDYDDDSNSGTRNNRSRRSKSRNGKRRPHKAKKGSKQRNNGQGRGDNGGRGGSRSGDRGNGGRKN